MGGCNSFAYILSDTIFGKDAPLTKHQNFDQIKVGDVLWLKRSDNGYNHVMVITSVDGNNYCACSGNNAGMVTWQNTGSITFLESDIASESYIFSRY